MQEAFEIAQDRHPEKKPVGSGQLGFDQKSASSAVTQQ
jgi:hypothetical protein